MRHEADQAAAAGPENTPELVHRGLHVRHVLQHPLAVDKIDARSRERQSVGVPVDEQPDPKFGAAEYIGDFTTNRYGRGHGQFKLIVEDAFALNAEKGIRQELDSVGFWFADQKDDDHCLGKNSPVTPFDGDAKAGVPMMNSGVVKLP